MNPIGKYFKTSYAHFYFYAEDENFKHRFKVIRVDDSTIEACFLSPAGLSRSTRKAFMKAYEKTMDKIDGIVDGKI